MKALGIAVLPRTARFDIQPVDLRRLQPRADRLGDKLRAVVAADVHRHAPHRRQLDQNINHITGPQVPLYLQRQASPRELVDHAQPLDAPSIAGAIEDEVPGPHMIPVRRTLTDAAVVAATQSSLLTPFYRHFQTIPLPQPIHPLAVEAPTF